MVAVLRNGGSQFPSAEQVGPEGLVAVGGDLSRERLLAAYGQGIFPWFAAGEPVMWWSPDPRTVLFPSKIRVSRSLRRSLRKGQFEIRFDTCFPDVIAACAAPRKSEKQTWITAAMIHAYCDLHAAGVAHSVEAWRDGVLVGGLYGIALGRVFCGESMFSVRNNASKVAMACLDRLLCETGFEMMDCQMYTPHLGSLGAQAMPRRRYLEKLKDWSGKPPPRTPWPAIARSSANFDAWRRPANSPD